MVSRPWHPGLPSRKRICDIRLGGDVIINVLVYSKTKVRVPTTHGPMIVEIDPNVCEWKPIEVPSCV